MTGEDGSAPFSVRRSGEYIIDVKKRRLKNVSIGVASKTPMAAHVQLRLTLSGPFVTVY